MVKQSSTFKSFELPTACPTYAKFFPIPGVRNAWKCLVRNLSGSVSSESPTLIGLTVTAEKKSSLARIIFNAISLPMDIQ